MPICSKNIMHHFNNLSLPERDENKITLVSVLY